MSGAYFLAGILSFIVAGFALAALLVVIGKGTSYSRSEPEKQVPYECGELPVVPTKNSKFSANYYTYALAFLLFDVEAALLVPWVVSLAKTGVESVIATTVFLAILLFGLFYALKSGGLKWE